MSPNNAIHPLYAHWAIYPLYVHFDNRLPVALRFLEAENQIEFCEFLNDMNGSDDYNIHSDYIRYKNRLLRESIALNQFAINDMMAFE